MKKRTLIGILLLGLLLTACGGGMSSSQAKSDEAKVKGALIMPHFHLGGYKYTVYANLHQLTEVEDSSFGVVALEILSYDEKAFWETAIVPVSIMKDLEKLDLNDPNSAFKLELTSLEESGGVIHLPLYILEYEQVDASEVVIMGGA